MGAGERTGYPWVVMRIYLLRHAVAVPRGTPGYPGDDRPLTEEGRRRMRKGARGLARLVGDLERIFASPLSRARETAQIAAEALLLDDRVEAVKWLLPGTAPELATSRLKDLPGEGPWMLVGHEPDFGGLAARWIGAPPDRIPLKKGGLCRIDFDGPPARGKGTLAWLLTPRHLRRMA